MPRFRAFLPPAAAILAGLLVACQTPPAGVAVHADADHPAAPQPPCNAAPVQHFIGHKAGAEVVARALKDSGATTHRVLAPDTPATLDLSQYRLDILTDAEGIITAVRCE